jgi:hypothetical protein
MFEMPDDQSFDMLYGALKTQETIKFWSTSFLRGSTMDNCIILVDEMQNIIDLMTEEEITKQFNEVCNEKLFAPGIDYSNFPVYSNDYLLKSTDSI